MTTLNVQDFGASSQTPVTDQAPYINAALIQARQLADPNIHNSSTGKFHTNIRVLDCVIQNSTTNAAVWALNWGLGCEVDIRGTQNKSLVWECNGSSTITGRPTAAFEPLP